MVEGLLYRSNNLKFYFDADFKFVLRDWEKGIYCCGNPYFTALRSS